MEPTDDKHQAYWRANLRVTGLLVSLWFFVTFVIGWFARDLDFSFFGWPFSFWVAAQGALVVYVLIIGFYAWYMHRLDRRHGVADDE
jgi:putative solute:sodium symporter small subunit